MNVLVDTHAILWWLLDDERLSRRARLILADSANRRWVSIAALWELAIKMSAGRLSIDDLKLQMVTEALAAEEFLILPIRVEDLLRLEQLSWIHRDPFDRLMIAQAIEQHLPMLTADTTIRKYPLETVW